MLFMLGGLVSIVMNDALTKFASQSMPLSQLMFVRGLFATLFLLVLGFAMGVPLRGSVLTSKPVLTRAGLDVLITVSYLVGLTRLPLANTTALYLTTPVILTLLGVLVFREEVKASRWLASMIGFLGVLLILQPASAQFNAWSLLIVLSAFLTVCRDLLLRSISRDIPSLGLTLVTTVLVVFFSVCWGMFQDWLAISAAQCGLLAGASVLLSVGFFFGTVAIREAEIAVIAPLRYRAVIFSAILGYVVWHDVPNSLGLCGMALTLFAGLGLVRR